MSAAESNTAWKNMSSATKTIVIVGSSLGVALVIWLNFVR